MKTEKQKLDEVIKVCESQIKLRDNASKPTDFDNGVVYMAELILRTANEK